MFRHATRRTGVAAAALLASFGLVVAAVPAQSAEEGPSARHKESGRSVDMNWLEVGTLPGVAGNIHFGYLSIYSVTGGETFVYGAVEDLQCPDGFVPEGPGGGHGGGEEEFPCEFVGTRFIDGGAVTFAMDKKITTGRLTGTLQVSDHDGTGLGTPPVDITLTGAGGTFGGKDRSRYTEPDGSSFSFQGSSTQREATIVGRIGPMVFDDEAGEFSSSSMGTFRQAYMQRMR